MRIGVPKEIKVMEGRVGLVPEACGELVHAGHEVWVQAGAGRASGFDDDAYRAVGARIAADAATLYGHARLVVKVKEPVDPEIALLRRDHVLFCYLHLAANPDLARRLAAIGLTAIAFETVTEDGRLPLLAPMSDVAGRIAAQMSARLLHATEGGKGLLLGGLPAAPRGHVVVLGGGVVGSSAARLAAAQGALVTVFERRRERLQALRELGPNVTALYPYRAAIAEQVPAADALIGAVLIPGARAPRLVPADLVRRMEPGGVVIDVAVDQGGCIETTRPTTWEEPVYVWEGVLHYGVTNMPGAVPRSASQALSAALAPFLPLVAGGRWDEDPRLRAGINVREGRIVHPAVLKALDGQE